mmetsp:Transcript_19347/g.64860  ORF Transcript_19347/g.64860 Transcript_19347/m.64860 type:complete len:209 (-) Transcript_19347:270-896(-)
MAVRMLEEWAFCPPMEPASALPMRFLCMLSRAMAAGVVLSTFSTMGPGITASADTDLPRPSTQLIAEGFLSVQKLPLRPRSSVPGKRCMMSSTTLLTPLDTMFMPMASPVKHLKRTCAYRPARPTLTPRSRPKREVEEKASWRCVRDCGSSSHALSRAASWRDGSARAGARVMPSPRSTVVAPPESVMARAPRCVEATRAPSVVAMGT